MSVPPDPRDAPERGGNLSLEHKLPLLMSGVLLVVLATSLALTYRTLIRSSETAMAERLTRLVRQLAELSETNANNRAGMLHAAARDSTIARVLLRAPTRDYTRPAIRAKRCKRFDAR